LESAYKIFVKNAVLTPFSVQQIVDCSGKYGNQGCDGGLMSSTLNYTQHEGIESNASYPYTGLTDKCKYNASKVIFKNTGFVNIPANNCSALIDALAKQPVASAVQASEQVF